MDETHLTSLSSITKSVRSPINNNRQRIDSTPVIQQSDVSSSRPALLAHEALGPLLFEALDGFFFTINHNSEFDFVSDNVVQYLKLTQEELTGRSLYHYVHPSDVGKFSEAWAKKDTGDSLLTIDNNEQQTIKSRGRTFLCHMRTNDDSNTYVPMVVSVALHRDSSSSDKTFLICIAQRPSLDNPKDKPLLLGFDQFSSQIDLNFDIKKLDSSHMKYETVDMNYIGKNFRDCVHSYDIPSIEQHFQEVIEKGEAKSSIYRFCLHNDIYAFINTRSKLFRNSSSIGTSDSIISTHTIARLIDNIHDLNGNASTRLMRSIISSNRDLQKSKQQQQQQTSTNQQMTTTPIGAQFALTMLGMHKNASNSLQQHVTSTLDTLVQVQNSLSTPTITSPHNKTQLQEPPSPMPNRIFAQKSSSSSSSSIIDNVSSSDTVEFGSKRPSFSTLFESAHSNNGNVTSPINPFDLFFSSPAQTNSNDFNTLLSSPVNRKILSPRLTNNDSHSANSSPKSLTTSRSSTRLIQLLTNKSSSVNDNPSQTLHYHPDSKLDEFIEGPESPTTTNLSPTTNDLSTTRKRRRNQNSITNGQTTNSSDILLKKILEQQDSFLASPIQPESNHSDDSSSNGQTTTKQRSDIYLRTLLNNEVRPQKVIVETPFVVGSRHKINQNTTNNNKNITNENSTTLINNDNTNNKYKTQLSLSATSMNQNNKIIKKQQHHSNSFGNQNNPLPRRPGRPRRNQSEHLVEPSDCPTPQSMLSDTSLDTLLDLSTNLEQSLSETSPVVLRRSTRQTTTTTTTITNSKRSIDNDEQSQNPRKYPKLLTQALKDVKIEYQDNPINGSSNSQQKSLYQSSQMTIKIEPELFNSDHLFDKNSPLSQSQTCRTILQNNSTTTTTSSSSSSSQSTLLRSLIHTPSPVVTTNKDAPLYDLLQNLDTTTPSNDNSLYSDKSSLNNSIDPFEQYLTPVLSQTPTTNNAVAKDDYLIALLNSDPQKPNEISFIPSNKQPTINDNKQITTIAKDLLNSTTNSLSNSSNDEFFSLFDNKDFLECLHEPATIESILSENSTNVLDQTFSSTKKRSEKDERAISEIYKTLVTSLNPGPPQQSLTVDNNLFNTRSGDFPFLENTNSVSSNRTVNSDSLSSGFCQATVPLSSTFSYSSNNSSQYSDRLSHDLLDNGNSYPPNVTLSPMNNSYPPQLQSSPMIMYSQPSTQPHIQHRQTSNIHHRQPPQQPIYNNYIQSASTNQIPSNYYSMSTGSVQQQQQQQLISPANHHSSQLINKKTFISQEQQRSSTQIQQQPVQLQMSMDFTFPQHMISNQQQISHRPMMNTYNDLMMTNNNNTQPLQQDYHQYSNNNLHDHSFNSDIFMSPSPTMMQQSVQPRHMNVMQHQQTSLPPSQAAMHQPYTNMNVALTTNIQPNTHNSNNLMNPSIPNLTPAETRQSEELNNQMMNCLSFQPARCTSEFVRKQLQNTIHGRQKPPSGKDMSLVSVHNSLSTNLDPNQKGAYFRNKLSS